MTADTRRGLRSLVLWFTGFGLVIAKDRMDNFPIALERVATVSMMLAMFIVFYAGYVITKGSDNYLNIIQWSWQRPQYSPINHAGRRGS